MSTKERPVVSSFNPCGRNQVKLELTTEKEVTAVQATILRFEYNEETGETIRFCKLGETDGYAVFATDYGERIYYGISEVYNKYDYDKAFNRYVKMIRTSN